MSHKVLKILLILFGVLVVLNLGVLDFFWYSGIFSRQSQIRLGQGFGEQGSGGWEVGEGAATPDSCGSICQKTIAEKIQDELEKISPTAGQSSISLLAQPTACKMPTSSPKKVLYIPLTTNGETVATSWTDIIPSEFYFDLKDYPEAKEVRFEAYLLALHGSAKVYVRLYDATNKRGVDYSDLSTQNDAFTRLESSAIRIWQGNNKYTVQLRSANGTQVQLKEAKLKILY